MILNNEKHTGVNLVLCDRQEPRKLTGHCHMILSVT